MKLVIALFFIAILVRVKLIFFLLVIATLLLVCPIVAT